MKIVKHLILIIFFFLIINTTVYGSDIDNILDEQINVVDFEQIDNVLETSYLEDYFNVHSFKELVLGIISGDIDFSLITLFESFFSYFLKEVRALSMLMGEVLILCILSQILKNLDVSFNKNSVGEIGFYVIYITLILLLLKSFNVVIDIVSSSINEIYIFMKMILPTMLMLVLASGNITSGTAGGSLIIFTLDILVTVIRTYLLPIVYLIVILQLINDITKQDVLSHLLDFVKQVISKALKYTVIAFSLLMGISNLTAPMVDGIINKGAKYAMGSIPVVGSALSGVVDTVLNCSVLIKNSVGIGSIIVIIIICLVPIVKLLAVTFVFKISASLVQPVSDERIVKALSAMGDYTNLLLGALMAVIFLFIAAVAILVTTTNITMMIR